MLEKSVGSHSGISQLLLKSFMKAHNDHCVRRLLETSSLTQPLHSKHSQTASPIPTQPFIKQLLAHLHAYLKSSQPIAFIPWLSLHFQLLSGNLKKNQKDYDRLVLSWIKNSSTSEEVCLLLSLVGVEYGNSYVIGEYIRLRKEIMRHSQSKSIDGTDLDYDNILHIFSNLYSGERKNSLCQKLKGFYQGSKTPFKCDTKISGPDFCRLMMDLFSKDQSCGVVKPGLSQRQPLASKVNMSQLSTKGDCESYRLESTQEQTFLIEAFRQSLTNYPKSLSEISGICSDKCDHEEGSLGSSGFRRGKVSLLEEELSSHHFHEVQTQREFVTPFFSKSALSSKDVFLSIREVTEHSDDSEILEYL